MNFRTTVVLGVLVVLIGGYLVLDMLRPPRGASANPDAPGVTVFNLQKFEFRGLTIRPAEGPEVVLRLNDADQWELDDPPVPAGNTAITDYVTRLMTLRSSGPAPEALRENFRPAVTVRISILGGKSAELAVAAPNAVGDTVARVSMDNRIRWLLVPRDTPEQLLRRGDDFRENRLVAVAADDIGTVTWQYPDRWLRLTRDADGWGFDFGPGVAPPLGSSIPPGTHRAESFVVSDVTRSLAGLRAAAFPRGVGLDDGFDAPQLVIRYTRFDARSEVGGVPGEREVRFGRFEDARRERVLALADVPQVRALVSASSLSALQLTPQRLRDRRVLQGLEAAAVETLKIERPDGTLLISRQPKAGGGEATAGGWLVNNEPADAQKVDKLVGEVVSLRAIRFVAGKVPEDAVPLTVQAGERQLTLRVGRERIWLEDPRVWGESSSGGDESDDGWLPAGGWLFESPTDLNELVGGDFRAAPAGTTEAPAASPDNPAGPTGTAPPDAHAAPGPKH